jgi:predicted alpha-1,6-mannanase (GH76 family)
MILIHTARRTALAFLALAFLLATAGCGGGGGPASVTDGGPPPDGHTDAPDGAPGTTAENVQLGDDWNAATRAALDTLAGMYDPKTGMFSSGHMWTWASGIEVSLTGYEKSTGAVDQYMFPATRDLRGFADFLEEFGYDDQAWWGDAWIRAYDVTGNRDYLELAGRIFADMRAAWDDTSCGGGVWWNPNRDFKNAVTAELFILLAANLHNRTPGDTEYLAWAQRAWTWFMGIGMVNDQQLINDGLRDCHNQGEPVWIYNQGIILGAAVELYRATSDEQYLTVATRLADASTTLLVDNHGILRERCEATGDCNDDQSAFKGIYQRYLTSLYELTGKPAYRDFLRRHARSIWGSRNANNDFGLSWSGPIDRVDSQRQISAANALAALAPPFTAAVPFARAAGGASFNHAMGHPVGPSAWACDAGSCPESGLVQTGPFLASLRPGAHTLHALIEGSATSAQAVPLAELEVYSETAGAVIASLPVKWSDLASPGIRRDFAVPFVHDPAKGPLEFRVRWLAAPGAPALTVHDLSIGAAPSLTAADLEHACGRLDSLERWSTDRQDDGSACTMLSGGALAVPAGPTVARFELSVDDFFHDDAPVATLAVVDHDGQRVLATQTLTRHAFHNVLLHGFDVPFQAEAGHAYDFTVERLASPFAPTLRARAIQVRAATTATPISLPFNARGIRQGAGSGELDTDGSAFSAQALGSPLYAGAHDFSFGPLTDGSANVVAASGQVVDLPAHPARALELLAFATYGTQAATFRVDYTDGTSASFTRRISDWWATSLQADEDYGVAASYFWKTGGRQYGNFHVFLHALPLDPTKVPSKLTLPNNPKIKVLAASAVTGAP